MAKGTVKSFDEVWTDIENKFDWEKVHYFMKLVNWEWSNGFSRADYYIPTVDQLKETAKDLLQHVYDEVVVHKEQRSNWSTGGFEVSYEAGTLYVLKFTYDVDYVNIDSRND